MLGQAVKVPLSISGAGTCNLDSVEELPLMKELDVLPSTVSLIECLWMALDKSNHCLCME